MPVEVPVKIAAPTEAPARRAAARWAGFVDLGPAATARVFSRAIPIAEEIGVSLAFGGSSAWALWVQADYRFPATDRSPPVGVEMRTLALRGGLVVSSDRRSRLSLRAGAGAGVERASFSPRLAGGAVDLAPGGSFFVATVRALVGAQWRAASRVIVGLTLFCDLQTTDVHYDLHEPDGTARRVLVPFALQPGLTVTVSGRFGS